MAERIEPLTRTEIQQLLGYAQHCEGQGWYWGNAAQFRKRHDKIKAWLNAQIDAADVIPTVPSLRQNPPVTPVIELFTSDVIPTVPSLRQNRRAIKE